MRTLVYVLGSLVILGAFAWAAVLLDIPKSWVGVGLLLGVGIMLVKLARNMAKHPEA
jgi:hypothetical protein